MEIVFGKIKNKKEVKKGTQKVVCPLCNQEIIIGIENAMVKQFNLGIQIPHIHLHGNPLHAILCYVKSDLTLTNIGVIKSIEISRDSETFSQLMKKWTNPY